MRERATPRSKLRALAVGLALIAASFALISSTAEAAATSEKEGRKFSRKYVKQFAGRGGGFPDLGWKIRDCWRIGRDGAGPYRLFPGGVLCGYSSARDTGGYPCWVLGVVVKDGRKYIKADNVAIQPWRGDSTYCELGSNALDLPPHPIWGVTGDPLRPIASRASFASAREKRPPCARLVSLDPRACSTLLRQGEGDPDEMHPPQGAARQVVLLAQQGRRLWQVRGPKELSSEQCVDRELQCVSSFNLTPGTRA